MPVQKTVAFVGTARDDLRKFPKDARIDVGQQLTLLQRGGEPTRWKPMADIGAGAAEIIVHTGQAYRVFYVAKFPEHVYVLHAFEKKTQKTTKRDLDRGRARYKEMLAARAAEARPDSAKRGGKKR